MYAITPAMRLVSITKTPLRDLGCAKTAALYSTIILRLNACGKTTFTFLSHERFGFSPDFIVRWPKFIYAERRQRPWWSKGHVPILAENALSCPQSKNSQIVLTVFYNSDVQN
jgi:hypothetical protein